MSASVNAGARLEVAALDETAAPPISVLGKAGEAR